VKEFTSLFVWVVVVGAIFAFLWYKGFLQRLANYVRETREELKKCTWPSVDELKGSTIVVMVTIAILGLFTVSIDFVIDFVIRFIT
jgi:preprotein translocase subunit SecE